MGWDAGGIWNDGTATVFESTIMANQSGNSTGYGIQNNGGVVYVTRSTIARNHDDAGDGGDIANVSGQVSITGSILGLQQDNCLGSIQSFGYNVITYLTTAQASSCPFTAQPSDHVGINPSLGALRFNGGLTRTALLLAGSLAIDQIPVGAMSSDGQTALCQASGSTDQRGVSRPQNFACDIGAYERKV